MPIKPYDIISTHADCVSDAELPLYTIGERRNPDELTMLSLFSGCGGMDLGFEGK